MSKQIIYTVPGMTCNHCRHSVSSAIGGVEGVEVDLDTKLVTVTGADLNDEALRAAIVAAGYEAA